jgi:hypothetical protein
MDIYFSLRLGGEAPVSHLQGGGGLVLTWLPFVHPKIYLSICHLSSMYVCILSLINLELYNQENVFQKQRQNKVVSRYTRV